MLCDLVVCLDLEDKLQLLFENGKPAEKDFLPHDKKKNLISEEAQRSLDALV